MRAILLTLALLAVGCDTAAFTLPLPLGGSIVVPLGPMDECLWEHEHQHQEQIARMGSSRFLAAIAQEHATDGARCGPLEREAYERQAACQHSNWAEMDAPTRAYLIGCGP